jgi:HK97 family phage major capsid protein
MELKEIIEGIGRSFEEFKAANDLRIKAIEAKGHADPLLVEKVDRINAAVGEFAALKRQLEAIETAVARAQFPGGGSSKANPAMAAYAAAHAKWLRTGADAGLRDLAIQAAMQTQDDTAGGFLVSDPVHGPMKEVLSMVSQMRSLATVISIGTSEYKALVDQLGETSEDASETSTRAETDTPGLKEISIVPQEMDATPKVTQTMLDDAAFDIEAYVGRFLGRAFAKREGTWFWEGTGVKQAKGISAYTMIANASYAWGKVGYIAGGHATLLNKADALIELQHALKRPYRAGSTFLMNDTTLLSIRKLKDGEGNYLWRPGLEQGASETLLGKSVAIDDFVDDIGANLFPIWYANFKEAYLIVDRMGVRMLRDPYTAAPYVKFYTTKRVGGGIQMYEAIKALKIAV